MRKGNDKPGEGSSGKKNFLPVVEGA